MMEGRSGVAALKRSVELVRRSFRTALGAVLITVLIPAITASAISYVVTVTDKAYFRPRANDSAGQSVDPPTNNSAADVSDHQGFKITVDKGPIAVGTDGHDMGSRVRETILESLIQILWLPMHIFVSSFSAILIALLYLKTRQAGGECTHEFLAKFEEAEPTRKKWQERVRQRLIQSGRVTSKPT
jgi:hypothetical protein